MATLIVTYDLNKETSRPPLLKNLKELYPSWAKLSESSYAIQTGDAPVDVFKKLQKNIDSNDNLYVVTLKRPYYGRGPEAVNNWLEDNLPR